MVIDLKIAKQDKYRLLFGFELSILCDSMKLTYVI